jgi:carboxymethylenebutenolidase
MAHAPRKPHMLTEDIHTLVPTQGDFNRRTFVRTAVGSGFAAAVLPVTAQTVVATPSTGLVVGEVTVDVAGFKMPAYRAMPVGKPDNGKPAAGLPVVLVLSEIFGVHEHIADVARRFAQAGYYAIAPELFVRQGDAASYGEVAKLVAEVINKVPDAQVMADLDACLAFAKGEGANTSKLAVTGFCWGGRITWLYAAHNPAVKAGVAWYGRLVGATNALQTQHAVDVTGKLHGPVLGLYGEKDTGIPLTTVDQMKAALATAGAAGNTAAQKSSFVVYPDAPHAFHADYRPSYRKEAADDGWKRCLAWFKANGVV